MRLLQIATRATVHAIDLFAVGSDPGLTDLFAALATAEVVGHNLHFDLRMLAPLGFTPGRVYTMLASQVLRAGRADTGRVPLRHALGDVASRELGLVLDKSQQASNWTGPLTPAQIRYAAADAAVLLPLADNLRAEIAAARLTGTADLEMRALPGVAWAGGVGFDRDAWAAQSAAAAADRDRVAAELLGLDPTGSTNWNSPAQVAGALKAVGIDVTSTADAVLAAIDHPLARAVRAFRAAAKRVAAYGPKWAAAHVAADGLVYPGWKQIGAATGRMSCSNPNLQQLPRTLRGCVVAPPGWVLVKADYSQVELRIAARISGDERMLAAYRAGEDLHVLTAALSWASRPRT